MKTLFKRTMNMPLVIAAGGAGTMEAVQIVTEQAQSPEAVQLILQILIGLVTLVKLWRQKPAADEKP
jgi:hypothetical protein